MDKNRWLKVGVGIIVLFLLGVFLRLARPILIPLALAFLFAFAVSPVLDVLVRRKVPKPLALFLVLVLSFLVLYLIGTVFYSGGKSLASELPSYTEMVRSLLGRIDALIPDPRLKIGLAEWIQSLNIGRLGTFLVSALGPFLSFMSDLLLVYIFMIFILAGRGRMIHKFDEAFPPGEASALTKTARGIDREIQKYLAIKTLTNVVIGLLTASTLAVFGVRFAAVFGVLAFLFNYVPTLGAIVSVALPALLTLFMEGGFTWKFWVVLVLLAAIHVVLDRFFEGRLMAKEISLSPLLVLFSLFFGAWLWGIPGLVLAMPILTALRIVFENVASLRFLAAMMDK